jgi:cytochrome oxidase Cu insertion factor (SCO1/SenC/PrrC family)
VISDIDFHQYRMGDCGMLVRARSVVLAVGVGALLLIVGGVTGAQQSAAPAPVAAVGPAVNDVAPNFTLAGATRYGLLKTPVTLADYRGRTVVLAFFFQARTKG